MIMIIFFIFIFFNIIYHILYIPTGGDIVDHAKRMLSHNHSGALLEHVWGPGDGRPVEALKVAVDQLVQGRLFIYLFIYVEKIIIFVSSIYTSGIYFNVFWC